MATVPQTNMDGWEILIKNVILVRSDNKQMGFSIARFDWRIDVDEAVVALVRLDDANGMVLNLHPFPG